MTTRIFQTVSIVRGVLAVSAVATTVLLAAFIDGLAQHYASDGAQQVLARTVVARFD